MTRLPWVRLCLMTTPPWAQLADPLQEKPESARLLGAGAAVATGWLIHVVEVFCSLEKSCQGRQAPCF